MRRVSIGIWAIVILAAATAGALPALRAYWWWRESNSIGRGAVLAARVGCVSCHGPRRGSLIRRAAKRSRPGTAGCR